MSLLWTYSRNTSRSSRKRREFVVGYATISYSNGMIECVGYLSEAGNFLLVKQAFHCGVRLDPKH